MSDRSGCAATRHGTYATYQRYGCRCPDAREDWRLYAKRRREGRAPIRRLNAAGTIRRIQALWAIGHNTATIADHAPGMSPDHILNVARGRRWVAASTAEAIRRAYDALSMTPGRAGITRNRALRAGYAPPLAWDDDTINDPTAEPQCGVEATRSRRWFDPVTVQRAIRGEQLPMSTAERAAAVAYLAQVARLTDGATAARLGITPRSVHRIRTAQHIPAVADHGRRTERAA